MCKILLLHVNTRVVLALFPEAVANEFQDATCNGSGNGAIVGGAFFASLDTVVDSSLELFM
jgi:hypothetical protein